MTAKIIHLEQFSIGCRHQANGVRFPPVYRVTGFEFDLVDRRTEHERFVPGKAPVAPFYTLSRDGDFGVADPTFRPVKVMEAGEDEGCIVVRHHTSRERAEAYIDGVSDLRPLPFANSGQMLWQTTDGVFTILHRSVPAGFKDRLIAYVTRVPLAGMPGFHEDAHHIVHPDGEVSDDPEIMWPSDSEIIG